MVITVTCPSCSSAFPVDPAKIPEGGVNARCTQCSDVFRVEKPADPAPEPVVELPEVTQVEEAPVAMEEAPEAPVAEPTPEPAVTSDPFEQVAPFEEAASDPVEASPVEEPAVAEPVVEVTPPSVEPVVEVPPPAAEDEAAPAVDTSTPGFAFGKRDPSDKAKRLARVLVSDMIMYNAERHQSALAGGTLVQDFEEEIDKSWKEFIDQVGEEMAGGDGRQYWTEALNDILAKGEQVF